MAKENKKPKNDKPKLVRRPYDITGFFDWVRRHALPSISLSHANVTKTLPPKAVRLTNYGYESPSYQPKEMDWGSYIGAGQTFVESSPPGYEIALLPVVVDGVTYTPAGVTSHTLKYLGLASSGANFRSQTVGTKFSISDNNNTFVHHYFIADTGSAWVDKKFPNIGTIDLYTRDHTHYPYEAITDKASHSTNISLNITLKGRLKPVKWLPGVVQYDNNALMSWLQSRPKTLALYNAFINKFK